MASITEKLGNLLNEALIIKSPILSGNMKSHISIVNASADEITICIEAPFYDMKIWNKEHKIVHTKQSYGNITDYAMWVNDKGAFGRKNKSTHWVNKTCLQVCNIIAQDIGAKVINELEVD